MFNSVSKKTCSPEANEGKGKVKEGQVVVGPLLPTDEEGNAFFWMLVPCMYSTAVIALRSSIPGRPAFNLSLGGGRRCRIADHNSSVIRYSSATP